jgi:hypothetical protein
MYRLLFVFWVFVLLLGAAAGSCSDSCSYTPAADTQSKASSSLLAQVALRQEQMSNPSEERLAQMKLLGMNMTNIGIQRIYIYLKEKLSDAQSQELKEMGIVIYPDSWIPPVGNHPNGYLLADMPVDSLDTLARLDYVVKLDTAEKKLELQQ